MLQVGPESSLQSTFALLSLRLLYINVECPEQGWCRINWCILLVRLLQRRGN